MSKITAAYPLAPGQAGILFQSLGDGAKGAYVIQIALDIQGTPNPQAERTSWDALVARHDVLRTAFVWKDRKQPLQVVGSQARAKLSVIDLSDLDDAAQSARFDAWLATDRSTGFDLSHAPLLRITRFQRGRDRHRIIVTFHHAILDGWSIPLLLQDWIALYSGRTLPTAPAFQDYVAWAQAQDRTAAQAFWQTQLADHSHRSLHLPAPEMPPASLRGDLSRALTPDETKALAATLLPLGVTMATAVQGAWALLLGAAMGADDVIYGVARSVRPAALTAADRRVGMYLNTLPMRARIAAKTPLHQWLAELQTATHAQAGYEASTLADALRGTAQRGLSTAVVFENYPRDPALLGRLDDFTVEQIEVFEQTSLDLTLFAIQDDGLMLRLLFDARTTDAGFAKGLLADLHHILRQIGNTPETPLGDISIASHIPLAPAAETPALTGPALPEVAAIWCALLELPTVSGSDNFFDLGGESLLVLSLQDRIRTELGVEVEIPDLFRHATLSAQSAHVQGLRDNIAPALPPRSNNTDGRKRLQQRRALLKAKEPTQNAQ
ncbi:condensation domain-containing protein [Pseudorhodobacter aquimaris]|uniref:condensation domain-containing protein n=1 Tax=Pseudorhodobacter aquimaris TaxID=687412 RepID=UPI00067B15F0|nr:condensation domain-containing protein [Pseudorhodobacter aquimaris]